MDKKTFLITVIAAITLVIIGGGSVLAYQYWWLPKNAPEPIACTQEAKICSDGSAVGRIGPNCEFAACPGTGTEGTAGWETKTNSESGFEFKYPSGFFNPNQEPKILIGDCDYGIFSDKCPNIDNLVVEDLISSGGDAGAIKGNLAAPNYWNKPNGEKLIINNVPYCLYQTGDAAMSQVYNSYYYATIANNKCLAINLNTHTTNCEVYLPIEEGNTQQQKNYSDCLATNQNQPKVLNQILATFKFTKSDGSGSQDQSVPKINSIAPVSGPKGTTVEIRGTGLSGFEGDLDVYFERADGKRITLSDSSGDYAKTQDKLIRVKLTEPCQKGEKVIGRYSGLETECDYIELTPGSYKVYTEPWGKKSNAVGFTITAN